MEKNYRQSLLGHAKPTKHEQEMEKLRAHHERLMKDASLRKAALIDSGVFVRTADGKVTVAKPYQQVIIPKRAA